MASSTLRICLTAAAILTGSLSAIADDGVGKPHRRPSVGGGYSYNASQTINTSGDARGKYGAADSLRDPNIDRQTNFGPFDHGFFYDSGSGAGQHGGNAPYLH